MLSQRVAKQALLGVLLTGEAAAHSVAETEHAKKEFEDALDYLNAAPLTTREIRESLDEAARLIGLALDSELAPVVLDLHNLSVPHSQSSTGFTLVLGFAGTREEVEWQLATSCELGLGEPSSLAYDDIFWTDGSPAQRLSCLPSRLADELRQSLWPQL